MAIEADVKEWTELQGINEEEFNKRFGTGEFDKFMNNRDFVEAHRSKKLFEKAASQPDGTPPTSEPAPEKSASESDPKDDDPLWKKEGYENEKEFYESVGNMRELLDKKQQQIDRFNGERGRLTKENKAKLGELESEIERLRQELKDKGNQGTVQHMEPPELPIPPSSTDEDYDSKYLVYQNQMKDYNTKQKAYAEHVNEIQQRNSDLEKRLSATEKKTQTLESSHNESNQDMLKKQAQQSWLNTMKEVDKLQELNPALKLSKSFEEINAIVRGQGYTAAAKIYPKKDIDNFDRICEVIKEYYHVDEDGNILQGQPPKHRTMKAAYFNYLESRGELDSFINNAELKGERKGREQVVNAMDTQRNHATTLPPGGAEGDPTSEKTQDDIVKKLIEYSKPEYDARLDSDPAFRKEVYDLMKKAGEKEPQWLAMISPKWKEEFEEKPS